MSDREGGDLPPIPGLEDLWPQIPNSARASLWKNYPPEGVDESVKYAIGKMGGSLKCQSCGSHQWEISNKLGGTPYIPLALNSNDYKPTESVYPLYMAECRNCSLVWFYSKAHIDAFVSSFKIEYERQFRVGYHKIMSRKGLG